MRRVKLALIGALMVVLPVLSWAPPASAAGTTTGSPTSATGTTWAFRLVGPNTALATVFDEHHQPGDWIKVTGFGIFSPAAGWILAGGTFTHYNADGTIHMRGIWVATGITGFTPFGGPNRFMQGGVLSMTTAHYDQNGNPCDCMGSGPIPMTVTSVVNAPPGTVGGTTVGPFTQPTGGSVVFAVLS